jgi:hypothetical protein
MKECFVGSVTDYTSGFRSLAPWAYPPTAHLNYCSYTIELFCNILSFSSTYPITTRFITTEIFLFPSPSFFSILPHSYFYFLSLFFTSASCYIPSAYFGIYIREPHFQNLFLPNYFSFTLQYMAPIFLLLHVGQIPSLFLLTPFSVKVEILIFHVRATCSPTSVFLMS